MAPVTIAPAAAQSAGKHLGQAPNQLRPIPRCFYHQRLAERFQSLRDKHRWGHAWTTDPPQRQTPITTPIVRRTTAALHNLPILPPRI